MMTKTSVKPSVSNSLLLNSPFLAPLAAMVVAALIALFLYLTGALFSQTPPLLFTSLSEYQGMLLTIIIIPTYATYAFILTFRKSLSLAIQIDESFDTSLYQAVLKLPLKPMSIAIIMGALYALIFNVPGSGLDFFLLGSEQQSITVGQIFMWGSMFPLLLHRLLIARAFNLVGANVSIDIFTPSRLNYFAQNGLIDALAISIALVLTTAQSLDFSFRLDNYSKAFAIAGPAILYLSIQPMYTLHKRMKAIRNAELAIINTSIAKAAKTLQHEDMQDLEVLLQRRDRLSALSTWPVNTTIIQRFILYVVLPPLAWVGAALVEELVT